MELLHLLLGVDPPKYLENPIKRPKIIKPSREPIYLITPSEQEAAPVAWEAEVKALNAAHKKVIDARRANYRKVRPPRRRTRPYFPREVRKM